MWHISDTELEAIKEWFVRIYGTVFAFLFGWGALIAIESRNRKLTTREKWTSFLIAAFVAYIADGVLTNFGIVQLRGVLVGIATLGSNGIVVWYLGNNSRILDILFSIFLKSKGISETKPEEKQETDDTVDKPS